MDLIQKLKIKPKQENKISFDVNIRKGAVKVPRAKKKAPRDDPSVESKSSDSPKVVTRQKGFIVDKTDEGFNRQQFLDLFKNKRKVKSLVKTPQKRQKIFLMAG